MTQTSYVRTEMLDEQPPPALESGAIKWLRENLFAGWLNSIMTVVSLAFLAYVLAHILPWFYKSAWNANSLHECRALIVETWGEGTTGACWAVIRERWAQFLYGFYPSSQYWRPNLAFVLLFVALAPVLFNGLPRILLVLSAIYPGLAFWLLWGGSAWVPVSIYLGPVLAVVVHRVVSGAYPALATVAAVAALLAWWLLLAGNLARGLERGMDAISILTTAFSVLAAVVFYLEASKTWRKSLALLAAIAALLVLWGPISGVVVMRWQTEIGLISTGGFGWLQPVASDAFGGFVLSITIGVTAIGFSLPLGILLALGRRSDMVLVKMICVGFIEFIRGVPLITLLFTASLLLNYFLPPGTVFDIILRVIIMVTLFSAAYIAEVVRGGLAALPRGQYEAADALGLDYWKAQRLIIMPQALKISIPGIVSTFIGLFKDTTLVIFVGLLDPLKGISDAVRASAAWNGVYWEPFIFVGAIFFVICFGMSRYSMYLERKLNTEHR